MILKSVFHIMLLLLWPLNTLAEQAAVPLTKHNIIMAIEFSLRIEADQNFSRLFEISYGPDISPFIGSINLEVLEILVGREKLFYCTKLCLTYIPSSTSLFNKKQCNKSFYFTERQGSRITAFKNFREMHALIPDATDWTIYSFSFDVFAGEASSPASKFLNEGLAYVLGEDDESNHQDATFRGSIGKSLMMLYRFYNPWLVLALGAFYIAIGRWLCIILGKIKDIKVKEKFFKRNGGLILQQIMNSYDGRVDSCKLFNLKELDKATNHFNVNRILGQGGQGTVYKGTLKDGRIIAVKKSKVIDEGKLEEFINEIFILSQINHRNVVKLLGCCLETEVPLLVYECISNGTLFGYLNDQIDEFPLTWDMRLRIATEVAGALSYMHSAATIPIYHRDIKSTNILLDEKCRAKVADFGTSKFVAIDQTHVTTKILGTIGYLDPEYYQSSQLTDKSDVYSFGVVLAELLTGKKSIFSTNSQENMSLATYFVHFMKQNRLKDILDGQVMELHGKKNDQIMAFANLARRCLNPNGKKRPNMEEVSMELKGIRASKKKRSTMFREIMKRLSLKEMK